MRILTHLTNEKLTLKPPLGNCEQPVANCNNRAISVCEKLLTATQNQSVFSIPFYAIKVKKSFILLFSQLHCTNKFPTRRVFFTFKRLKVFYLPRTFLNSALPPFTI
jgi:hypothetical protein